MPTTAAGTVYTDRDITVNGFTVRYSVADNRLNSKNLPTVLYCHGTNGDHDDYDTNPVKFHLMDKGGVLIQAATGNEWGGPDGIAGYRASYDAVADLLSLGALAIIGSSLGGVAAVGLFVNEPLLSAKANGLVILSGTADLVFRWDYGTTADREGLAAAYGVAVDRAAFVTATENTDPMRIPATAWDGKRVFHAVASGDTSVIPSKHGLALRRRIATGTPSANLVHVISGGDHNSTKGDTATQNATNAFLDDALGFVSRPVLSMRTSVPIS